MWIIKHTKCKDSKNSHNIVGINNNAGNKSDAPTKTLHASSVNSLTRLKKHWSTLMARRKVEKRDKQAYTQFTDNNRQWTPVKHEIIRLLSTNTGCTCHSTNTGCICHSTNTGCICQSAYRMQSQLSKHCLQHRDFLALQTFYKPIYCIRMTKTRFWMNSTCWVQYWVMWCYRSKYASSD